MKGRITEKGKAVVELMEHEGISLEEALERMDPPTSWGDATQPDPAVIERAAEALWDEMYVTAWSEATADEKHEFGAFARAAAAVIVPATAEAIAVAFEHEGHIGFTHFAAVARSFAAGLSADATTWTAEELAEAQRRGREASEEIERYAE